MPCVLLPPLAPPSGRCLGLAAQGRALQPRAWPHAYAAGGPSQAITPTSSR
jgi:hypothetical protein